MLRFALLLILIALSGCTALEKFSEFAQEHPIAAGLTSALIIGAALSAGDSANSGNAEHDVSIPPNPCKNPETCR